MGGGLDPSVLARAPWIFDQSPRTIASELLQNARRAGATTIEVRIGTVGGRAECEVSDDGRGVDDPQDLVTFGGSGWDHGSAPAEDWAGMGTFVLATRGCSVHSLGFRVELAPDTYAGKAEAEIRKAPHRTGTAIRFPCDTRAGADQASAAAAFREAFRIEATFGPCRVKVDGTPVARRRFLAGADELHAFEGVTIGLYGWQAWRARCDERPPEGAACMGGKVASMPSRHWPHMQDRCAGSCHGLVEVGEGAATRLRLPTRDRIVRDAAWTRLKRRIETLMISRLARTPGHGMSRAQCALARAAGLPAEDAPFELHLLREHLEDRMAHGVDQGSVAGRTGRDARFTARGARAAGCMLLHDSLARGSGGLAALAVAQATGADLAHESPGLRGLPDYERLPRVVGIAARVEEDGFGRTYRSYGATGGDDPDGRREDVGADMTADFVGTRPEHIAVTLLLSTPDPVTGRRTRGRYGPVEVDHLAVPGNDCHGDTAQLLLRGDVGGARLEAIAAATAAAFTYEDSMAAKLDEGEPDDYRDHVARARQAVREAVAGDETETARRTAFAAWAAVRDCGMDDEENGLALVRVEVGDDEDGGRRCVTTAHDEDGGWTKTTRRTAGKPA